MQIPERFVFPSEGFEHYWTEGHGKALLNKIDRVPTLEDIQKYIPKLFEQDVLADEVVRELYLKLGYKEADSILQKVLKSGIDSETPECLVQLFTQMETIPIWFDKEKFYKGATFCRRSGALGLIVLRNYSLMGGYESSAINKALIFTGALKKGATKRINETTEFWIDITGEGAIERNGVGFKSCVRTRLMHAYARLMILQSPDWKNEAWGAPINQWDMVATNMGFSLVYMNGLNQLGYLLTEEENDGLFHFWKYIGYLIGIEADYLPNNEKEAIAQLYGWTMTQPPADTDTKTLAKALMVEPLTATYIKFTWQKKLVLKIHLGYNYFFLGKRSCQHMDLPSTVWRFYPKLVRFIKSMDEFFVQRSNFIKRRRARRGRKTQQKIKDFIVGLGYNK